MGEKKEIMKNKWLIGGIAVAVLAVGTFAFIQTSYVNQNNISSKMKNNAHSYLEEKEKEYFVYFYDKKECDSCGDYVKELKKYEEAEKALPIYKVNIEKSGKEMVENDLFIDKRYPTLVHVEKGNEQFRYVGAYPIEQLPKEGDSSQSKETTEKPVKETKTEE